MERCSFLCLISQSLLKAGFYGDALYALEYADSLKTGYCFPNRLEDIAVLQYAMDIYKEGANAHYYLGCLYYDKFRYKEAAAEWEACVSLDGTHGKAWRNLSLYYFDKANTLTMFWYYRQL